MNNPAFASAFSKANQDLMNKINALKNNSNEVILSKDELLKNIDNIKKFNDANIDSKKLLALDLLNKGNLDPKQLIDAIRNGILDEKSKSSTKDEILEKLLDEYNNIKLSDKEKSINTLSKEKLHKIEEDAISNLLNSINNQKLIDSFSNILSTNPEINEKFNKMLKELDIKLTPEEIKQKLLEILKNGTNDSTLALLDSLVIKKMIEDTVSDKINDMIRNDPKNVDNNSIQLIIDEKIDSLDKLKKILNVKPNINDDVKKMLADLINTLGDSELQDLFATAAANPAFLNALKNSKNADSETQQLMDNMNKLNLSPDEMRISLINGDNSSIDFGTANNKIMSKYEDPKPLSDELKNIDNDLTNNNNIKDKDNIKDELGKISDNIKKM